MTVIRDFVRSNNIFNVSFSGFLVILRFIFSVFIPIGITNVFIFLNSSSEKYLAIKSIIFLEGALIARASLQTFRIIFFPIRGILLSTILTSDE